MRAVIVDPKQAGRLLLGNAAPPRPAYTEALVRVLAFSLNRGEVRMTRAPRPNWRPGWDLAGTVEKAAEDGSGPPVGHGSSAYSGPGPGPRWRQFRPMRWPRFRRM